MARRRTKRRTHLGSKNASPSTTPAAASANSSASRTPKSMVIRVGAGDVGPSVSQLVKDVRQMMEPHTASRLRERRSNRLRDYTTMAGPLGVSHLLLISRSAESGNVNLRLALTPRGPTMHFRVESYSLCKDIKRAMRRPPGTSKEYTAPPLLVMNNFASPAAAEEGAKEPPIPKRLEALSTSVFQSLFPAISPASTPLSSIQRVLLLNREQAKGPSTKPTTDSSSSEPAYVLNLRHYAISTKRVGMPKAVRRINAAEKVLTDSSKRKRALPNLGKLTDVADYLLDPGAAGGGFTSGSESEAETDAEVEVLDVQAKKVISRKKAAVAAAGNKDEAAGGGSGHSRARVEKRAVQLAELGPRMRLRLVKVEEGVCGGKVMWHEWIKKTRDEEREQDQAWDERRRLKEERRRQQKENVAKKKGDKSGGAAEDGPEDELGDDWDSEDFEDEDEDEDMVDQKGHDVEEDGQEDDEEDVDKMEEAE